MISYFYGNWDYWDLKQKVTFDGVKKLIYIAPGVTELDVKQDLYSDWKAWALLRDNFKFPQAMSSIGGETLPGGRFVGSTFFLLNGWRIRTWEGSHTLTVYGNLFTTEGEPNFVPTLESWTITINSFQSTLIDGVTGLTDVQNTQLFNIPTSTLTSAEHQQLMAIPASGAQLNISGMTQAEHDKLMAIPTTTLESDERAKLMAIPVTGGLTVSEHDRLFSLPVSSQYIDLIALVDDIWAKEVAPGVTAAEYLVKKLLTTNKFIGLS